MSRIIKIGGSQCSIFTTLKNFGWIRQNLIIQRINIAVIIKKHNVIFWFVSLSKLSCPLCLVFLGQLSRDRRSYLNHVLSWLVLQAFSYTFWVYLLVNEEGRNHKPLISITKQQKNVNVGVYFLTWSHILLQSAAVVSKTLVVYGKITACVKQFCYIPRLSLN